MSTGFTLGQPVKISGTAAKIKEWPRTFYKESALPYRDNYPTRKTFTEGVIVGSRTVIDGEAWSDYYGRNFSPTCGTGRRVWLVAFDLRMKPSMCFDHQVEAFPTPETIEVPTPYVPYPGARTQAHYRRTAAKNIRGGYPISGSNVTTAVIKLLDDIATAMDVTQ